MHPLAYKAFKQIEEPLLNSQKPCVLYSGGFDSQILLWMARQARPDVTAVYFEMYEDARKKAHVNETCHMWKVKLDVRRPHERDLIGNGAHVEVFNGFALGDSAFWMGLQATAPESNARHLCAVQLRYEELPARSDWDYDLALMGSRDDDTDAAFGSVPVGADEISIGGVRVLYPLRSWTYADTREVSFACRIPQNWRRYDKQTGAKMVNPTWDNDRYHLCTNCLEPGRDVEFVDCPKQGRAIYVGDLIDLDSRRLVFEQAALNIRRNDGASIRTASSSAG